MSSANPPPTYDEATALPAAPQQPRYHAIVIGRAMHVTPVLSSRIERQFPLAGLFFILGWICPPMWIIGACCCLGSIHPYEAWWASVNLYMAITFILTSIIYSMIVIANQS